MKRHIILILLALFIILPAAAQKEGKRPSPEEMMKLKIEYISEEIELRDDQKKQFNEIYSQMDQERRAVFKKMKEAENRINNTQNATEADYEKASQEINQARHQMTAIENNYDRKFEKILSKKQLFKMKEAETKFWEKMRKIRNQGKHKKEKK